MERKQNIQITSAQYNFDDIFQFSSKSIEIDRKCDQTLPLVFPGPVIMINTRNFSFQAGKRPLSA